MLIPEMLTYMRINGFSYQAQALVMGAYVLGLYAFGPFVSYLVERYRRKRVCQYAILLLIGDILMMLYLRTSPMAARFELVVALRFILGAVYGLAQMVLLSTLVVDSVQSYFRTEANYHINWFGRLAVALGPLISLVVVSHVSLERAFLLSVLLSVLALLLISVIRFPFKTPPDNIERCSLDRFLLPGGVMLFVCLALIMVVVGMLYTLRLPAAFFAWMLLGLFVAVLVERIAFVNAELKSQAVTALLAMIIALFLLIERSGYHEVISISATLLGLGVGVIGTRFLLFFIKLSTHCQRGTSQSSYFLSWETGIGLGVVGGLAVCHGEMYLTLWIALAISIMACMLYVFYLHRWFMKHKNR